MMTLQANTRRDFVRGLGACASALLAPSFARAATTKPNFVFILADDQGWNCLAVPMRDDIADAPSDFHQTPRLAKLASQGMRFSQAYAPAPVCAPTRAAIQTGKSPAQLHFTNVGPGASSAQSHLAVIQPAHINKLPLDETTVAELLRTEGYATAHFGKWHLDNERVEENNPGDHGYDVHDGPSGNRGTGHDPETNPKDAFGITERASAFMEKSVADGKPFYAQLSHYAVHGPIEALAKTTEKYAALTPGKKHSVPEYAAMMEHLDTATGMIVDKLEALGVADNTYIVYMSDNGAPKNLATNEPLAGAKGSLWEGGVRVPMIVCGPGVAKGSLCHTPVVGMDLLPTWHELAAVAEPLPKGVEGGSLTPLFKDGTGAVKRSSEEIVFHFPHYGMGGARPHSTIIHGDYKLIRFYEEGQRLLFNLKDDIGEYNDLAKTSPERVAALERRLDDYLKRVDAQMPTKNPDYDPTRALFGGRRRQGKGKAKGTKAKGAQAKGVEAPD